ncbi:hypothetical protein FACS189485_19110 [Spirochaetia bacterium]|nr:hypothetical protein FACS189485_19110 [Spirochaetia bacterium]
MNKNIEELMKLFDNELQELKKPLYRDLEELIRPLSMDSIHLVKTQRSVFTKIGGQPFANKNFKWPKWNNQSLAFIMQIKLSEITLLSQIKLFPQEGLLYIFYDKKQSTWGFDPKDKGSWKIIFEREHDNLITIPYPTDLENDYRYEEKRLIQKIIKTYPSWEDEMIKSKNLTDEQEDLYMDFTSSVYCCEPEHQIAGIACAIQSPDMELECQLVSNGLYLGDSSVYDDPRSKELEKNKSDWILLLQIGTDDDVDMMWGDGGMLYFWIKKDDLAKLNFEDTWMILQCG